MAKANEEPRLARILEAMAEQMRLQHAEMKSLFAALAPSQKPAVQDASNDQYDQLSKDVQKFVPDDDTGNTFDYWFKRYGPLIRDSSLPDGKKRDLVLMKLDEEAYRKCADDMDSTGMEQCQDIHAVQEKKVKCYCGGPHYRSTCPLLSSNTGQEMRQKKSRRKRSHRREKNQCKNVVSFAAENARTYLDVNIRGRSLHFLLDTGADITLISRRTWKRLGSPTLEPFAMPVKTADGSPMKIDGRFSTDFSVKDRITGGTIQGKGLCYVTESTNLLGLEWCIQLPAYKELKEKYHCRMVAQGESQSHHGLEEAVCRSLQDNAVPVFKKKRPVPYASVPDLDEEIDRLVAEGVISPADHSEWAAPIVVVKKKNGKIRLCADFSTGLNDTLQLHQHPLSTAEDVFTKLNGGQLFTQIDFTEAYLQVEVDEESKEINTHRGLFRYNRLPFSVKSAPGIFQQIMNAMICGLEGVAAYLDDVIVTGCTDAEHRQNLEALFRRIQEYGFHVRMEKCNFLMPQIRYDFDLKYKKTTEFGQADALS
ncbi:reverse transcriptase, partial [Oesophagostomum dentatum]